MRNNRLKIGLTYAAIIIICAFGAMQSWQYRYAQAESQPTPLSTQDTPYQRQGQVPPYKPSAAFVPAECVNCRAHQYFSPRDDIRSILLALLDGETTAVQVAAFKLTDASIAEKLIALHKRGVHVELLVDGGELDPRLHKTLDLHRAGIPVYLFPCKKIAAQSRYAILHHKFMVLHRPNATGGREKIVITGSLNLTKSAMESNRENILVIISTPLGDAYAREFEYITKNEADQL